MERPEDLAAHAAILNLNSPRPDAWVLSRGSSTTTVAVAGPVSVNNFGTMRELAVLGLGIAGLHEPMALNDVRAGRLQRVLPDWIIREAPVYAIMPSRLVPAKTRLFLDMLDERVTPRLTLSDPTSTSPAESILRIGRAEAVSWWAARGSNPRPPRCKRGALPLS